MMASPGTGTGGTCLRHAALSVSFSWVRLATVPLLLLVAVLTGCTTLQPVAMDPGALQENIRGGTAVHAGDTIRVVTRDGVSRRLVVTAVEGNSLMGHAQGVKMEAVVIEIPIDDIILIEEEKVSGGETAVHSVGAVTIAIAIFIVLAAMFGI